MKKQQPTLFDEDPRENELAALRAQIHRLEAGMAILEAENSRIAKQLAHITEVKGSSWGGGFAECDEWAVREEGTYFYAYVSGQQVTFFIERDVWDSWTNND